MRTGRATSARKPAYFSAILNARPAFTFARDAGFRTGVQIAELLNAAGVAAPYSQYWTANSINRALKHLISSGQIEWGRRRRKPSFLESLRDKELASKFQENMNKCRGLYE